MMKPQKFRVEFFSRPEFRNDDNGVWVRPTRQGCDHGVWDLIVNDAA
jgi:hypothetical protein